MDLAGIGVTSTQVGVKHNLDIEDTSILTTVKDDCRIKLMYYLQCFSTISKLLDIHPKWRKYTEYKTCNSWTIEEEEELYHICSVVINMSVARETGFVEVPDELLTEFGNRFIEITDRNEIILKQLHVHISENSFYGANRIINGRSHI